MIFLIWPIYFEICHLLPWNNLRCSSPLISFLSSPISLIFYRRTRRINLMAYELSEQKKVGLGLIGFGILFSFLAMILFFDRGLLALGNILWLTGVTLLLGFRSMIQLFTNKMNYKGSVSFLLGIFFIFVRWPIVGIAMELYGCLVLFGGFWPTVQVFLYQIPIVGWLLQYPALILGWMHKN